MSRKILMQVNLDAGQMEAVKRIASEARVSTAELIRQAIDLWLRETAKHPKPFGGTP